jgi:aryl-alcohol dehydrogenase-like predicted oxidoreductase
MSFGRPSNMQWTLPEEQALPIIKHAYDNGINTWDTVSRLLPPNKLLLVILSR